MGKGAGQVHRSFQVHERSAVPTRQTSKQIAQERVGTAHARFCPHGKAMRAPLPTLQEHQALRPQHSTSPLADFRHDLRRQRLDLLVSHRLLARL